MNNPKYNPSLHLNENRALLKCWHLFLKTHIHRNWQSSLGGGGGGGSSSLVSKNYCLATWWTFSVVKSQICTSKKGQYLCEMVTLVSLLFSCKSAGGQNSSWKQILTAASGNRWKQMYINRLANFLWLPSHFNLYFKESILLQQLPLKPLNLLSESKFF